MEMKIIWFGAVFLVGWIWAYLFVRQFFFNLMVAKPLVKDMKKADGDLIAPGADKYTAISIGICAFFIIIACAVVIIFFKLYLLIAFFIGFVCAGVMVLFKMSPANRSMFDAFCVTYYRFVPDDELRTAMYNKKPSQMKQRLHAMDVSTDFIPAFEKK